MADIVNLLNCAGNPISYTTQSIYISVPWFRFTLMDLSFRVLFHRFQIIFDRIRPFLSQLELLK